MNREEIISGAIKQYNSKEVNKTADQLVELLTNKNSPTSEQEKVFISKLNDVNFEEFKQNFEGLSKESALYFYVWIGLTEKNDVVVVGRTSFSKQARSSVGDLFNSYSVFGHSKTQEIILNIIAEDEIDYLKDLNNRLNQFIEKAIIVAIDVSNAKDASSKETEIGNYLLESGIPILNSGSHKK